VLANHFIRPGWVPTQPGRMKWFASTA